MHTERRPFTGEPDDYIERWAFARYVLKLSTEEFENMPTPEYNALVRAYNTEQKLLDYRAACVALPLINSVRAVAKSWGWDFEWMTQDGLRLPFFSYSKPPQKKGPVAIEYEEYQNVLKLSRMMGGKGVKHV